MLIFKNTLSPVMNLGFFSLTQKQNVRVNNDTLPIQLVQKKARMRKSKVKTVQVCFVDSNGVVHKEFLPARKYLNQHMLRGILEKLRKGQVRETSHQDNWMLYHTTHLPHSKILNY